MPETIWTYLTAILYFTEFCTCPAIAELSGTASRDSLTGMLRGNRSGHELVEIALKTLFTITGGWMIRRLKSLIRADWKKQPGCGRAGRRSRYSEFALCYRCGQTI